MAKIKEFKLPPDWDRIEETREEVLHFIEENGNSVEISDAVSMVACELMENAVKFGDFSRGQQIYVTININPGFIITEVVNSISKGSEKYLKTLDDTIQWIRGFQDPFEAYIKSLSKISLKVLKKGESGLGLARIAYEGQSILDFYTDNDRVYISALYEF